MTSQHSERVPEWTLGDRLRKARSLTGMTIRQFADHIGVSHGTVTNAETDARQVRTIVINAYAMATGVPRDWLLTGIDPTDHGPGPDGSDSDTCRYPAIGLAGVVTLQERAA